jgi:hypothetical protein
MPENRRPHGTVLNRKTQGPFRLNRQKIPQFSHPLQKKIPQRPCRRPRKRYQHGKNEKIHAKIKNKPLLQYNLFPFKSNMKLLFHANLAPFNRT